MCRELLADPIGQGPNNRPYRIVRILRLQRQEKADEFLVMLHQLERLGPRADFLRDPVQLIVENAAQPLGKN